jgi:hypothetical protein
MVRVRACRVSLCTNFFSPKGSRKRQDTRNRTSTEYTSFCASPRAATSGPTSLRGQCTNTSRSAGGAAARAAAKEVRQAQLLVPFWRRRCRTRGRDRVTSSGGSGGSGSSHSILTRGGRTAREVRVPSVCRDSGGSGGRRRADIRAPPLCFALRCSVGGRTPRRSCPTPLAWCSLLSSSSSSCCWW